MEVLSRARLLQPGTSIGGAARARLSKGVGGLMLAAVFAVPATTVWAADEAAPTAADNDVLVTEFRGRPPFKRQLLSSDEVAELARFEESAPAAGAGETVRVADFRGKPPFKREVLSAEEYVELARFEETSSSEESDQRRRRGPPGKIISRR